MQRFECPFCGVRDETEFTYLTEAGIKRPEPSEGVSAEAWAHYLYMRRSPEGHARGDMAACYLWRIFPHDP